MQSAPIWFWRNFKNTAPKHLFAKIPCIGWGVVNCRIYDDLPHSRSLRRLADLLKRGQEDREEVIRSIRELNRKINRANCLPPLKWKLGKIVSHYSRSRFANTSDILESKLHKMIVSWLMDAYENGWWGEQGTGGRAMWNDPGRVVCGCRFPNHALDRNNGTRELLVWPSGSGYPRVVPRVSGIG